MKKNTLIPILIFGLCIGIIFLRFFKVGDLFFFDIDEEYQAFLAESIVKDFHIIWIGLSAGKTGFYVGPGFTYFNAFLFWLSKGDPLILGYAASLIGTCTAFILFYISTKYFGIKTAIIATILYGFSAYMNFYDRRFWNPTFVPLISLLLYYSFTESFANNKWIIVTAFLLGVMFHIHASLFVFIPLSIIIFYFLYRHQKKLKNFNWKESLFIISIAIITFLAVVSPLIVYDFVHNFDNIRTPIRLLQKPTDAGPSMTITQKILLYFTTISKSFYNDNPYLIPYLTVTIGMIIVWYILKKKNLSRDILAYILIGYTVFFIAFPGTVIEYYLLGLLPFIFIIFAWCISKLHWKLYIPLLSVYIVINLISLFHAFQDTGNRLNHKKIFVQKVMNEIGDKTYSLETTEDYLLYGGWRYLFGIYGKKPLQSQADQMFGWIYPNELTETKPQIKVIISPKNKLPDLKSNTVIKTGPYYGYIITNK